MNNIIKQHMQKLAGLTLAILLTASSYADTSEKVTSIFDLMYGPEVLDITIELDLDSIVANRRSKEDLKTTLSFRDAAGQWQKWSTDISIRGRFRRVHCATPPMKLDFSKSDLKEAGLAPFDDLKLVTQCVSDPFLARELILKEYLVYKMYNQLTEYSYRVQMVKVTYQNPKTGKEDIQWGFLIEDTAQLSARTGTETFDAMVMARDSFFEDQFRLAAVFQYMIGNPDWGIRPTKNLNYLQKEGKIIPVPYDFDFSALVAAPYAQPTVNSAVRPADEIISTTSLMKDKAYGPTLDYFQKNRKELISTVKEMKLLSATSRSQIIDQLRSFFEYNELVTSGEVGR